MFITEGVDLPEEIVDAHAKGRLVFFVGAGASMDPPSNLPAFKKLARELAEAARVPFDEDIAIDLFLGSMPADFDVHTHAHRLISPHGSAPNQTHRAIVRVASSTGSARIVTTNFDDHLSVAALSESVTIDDKWIGPALPLGDTFTGVVHLHGSTLRSPSELVLTDRDFGRAYLNDAWATRFLQRMFGEFTVLFIGYSLDDPIMRYLSLGLPSKTRRFVLTHKPMDEKWSHLGIHPISYPGTDSDHSDLPTALQAWDSRARMGQLEHLSRMREIVDGGPALTPVDRDYVMGRLRTVEGAADFARVATSVPWLQWAETLPRFRDLFNGGVADETSAVLANWFGLFVRDPDLYGAALQTVQRLGQQFSPALISSVSWSAEHLSRDDETAGRRWKTLLASSIFGYSAPPELGLLLPHKPKDRLERHVVIRAALRPHLTLNRRWYLTDEDGTTPPDAEVVWHTNETSLSAHLQREIQEAGEGDQILGALLEDALNNAYDLLNGYQGDREFDPMSFGRSAIEAHRQDSRRKAQDALIDALRDFGVKGVSVNQGLPERWWDQGNPLFRRLAIHVLGVDGSRTPDQKVGWLIDRDVLYSRDEKHESFRVLGAFVQNAGDLIRADLLSAVLRGPVHSEDTADRERNRAYATYNLLAWLTHSAPGWADAAAEFANIQTANPTFEVREHPDFDHWSSSGTWGGRLPVDPEDFIRDAEISLAAAFDGLIGRDYSERNFDEPTWDDALSVVRRVAETRPALGVRIWQLIVDRDEPGQSPEQLKRAVLAGWERADLGDEAAVVMALVAAETLVAESARSISQFVLAQIQKLVESDESPVTAALREIARNVWSGHNTAFEHGTDSQPSALALNSWPGMLADYWAMEVDRRWRHHRDDWEGLNEQETSAILELLNSANAAQDATRPALARSAFFLFAADPEFVEEHILPLFAGEASARQMWGTYLYHPRTNDRMLAAGLLDGLVLEWDRLEAIEDHGLSNQFYEFAASVVSFSGLIQPDRQRVLDGSVLASNGKHAADFASAVVRLLDSPEVHGAEVWDLWLRDHLTARLSGLPRTAHPEELARWADAVPFLGKRIPDAIDVFRNRKIGFGKEYRSPDFPKDSLSKFGPELVGHFAERVRNSIPSAGHLSYEVAELIEAARAVLGDAVQPILDEARERGFTPA